MNTSSITDKLDKYLLKNPPSTPIQSPNHIHTTEFTTPSDIRIDNNEIPQLKEKPASGISISSPVKNCKQSMTTYVTPKLTSTTTENHLMKNSNSTTNYSVQRCQSNN